MWAMENPLWEFCKNMTDITDRHVDDKAGDIHNSAPFIG